MEREPEAYVYIVKYKDDDRYYLSIEGDDDTITLMVATGAIHDQRLSDAAEVAMKYFDNYGGQSRN